MINIEKMRKANAIKQDKSFLYGRIDESHVFNDGFTISRIKDRRAEITPGIEAWFAAVQKSIDGMYGRARLSKVYLPGDGDTIVRGID